jgi:hypothetical protein
MARYDAGETLANIAKTYGCSPPAISYIVSRSRARGTSSAPGISMPLEPQLVKSHPAELPPRQPERREVPTNGPQASHLSENEPRLEAEGGANQLKGAGSGSPILKDEREAVHGNLSPPPHPAFISAGHHETRRALHSPPPHADEQQIEPDAQSPGGEMIGNSVERVATPAAPGLKSFAPSPGQGTNGAPLRVISGPQIPSDAGAFIDRVLRERVETDIASFLTAFDAALADDTPESRAGLREATDRLLRAGARTRIELERLEARVPLPPRSGSRQYEPAGRR